MNSVTPKRAEAIRRRQHSSAEIRDSLRELRIQLALLNYRVGSQLELKDVDLDCLDILDAHGPLSPTELARRAGLHPATMTESSTDSSAVAGSCANATPPTAGRSASAPYTSATPSYCACTPG
jgi:hypothetical protein